MPFFPEYRATAIRRRSCPVPPCLMSRFHPPMLPLAIEHLSHCSVTTNNCSNGIYCSNYETRSCQCRCPVRCRTGGRQSCAHAPFQALCLARKYCKIIELLLSDTPQKQFRMEKLQIYFQSVSIKHDLSSVVTSVLAPSLLNASANSVALLDGNDARPHGPSPTFKIY